MVIPSQLETKSKGQWLSQFSSKQTRKVSGHPIVAAIEKQMQLWRIEIVYTCQCVLPAVWVSGYVLETDWVFPMSAHRAIPSTCFNMFHNWLRKTLKNVICFSTCFNLLKGNQRPLNSLYLLGRCWKTYYVFQHFSKPIMKNVETRTRNRSMCWHGECLGSNCSNS